ncbi:hypothetical protein DCCM_4157 [Desulfocucumis palustris]|uniref:Uncharacterized protein n=1 Tax=Desulfocucumis palustris TaxID=1898651 RepID=A0A2L2XL58_9FIRM|nr:hypothetical protein DCCM_4157 [Desulfocucumis palustris]
MSPPLSRLNQNIIRCPGGYFLPAGTYTAYFIFLIAKEGAW